MLPVLFLYTVSGAIFYCAIPPYTTVGADAARFLYGWPGDPLLCYPPLHYCWRPFTCCVFWFDERRRVGRPFTVLLHSTAPEFKCCLF